MLKHLHVSLAHASVGRAAHMAVFVFKLHADYRAAVIECLSLDLLADFHVQFAHAFYVLCVVGARSHGLVIDYPVGQTAVTALAVRKRAYPQHQRHVNIAAHPDERAQIAIAAEVPFALDLLMVVPKYVRRGYLHAARAHLA